MMICALAGTTATFINHEIGYGSIIANELWESLRINLPETCGDYYTSSLVG